MFRGRKESLSFFISRKTSTMLLVEPRDKGVCVLHCLISVQCVTLIETSADHVVQAIIINNQNSFKGGLGCVRASECEYKYLDMYTYNTFYELSCIPTSYYTFHV